MIRDLITRDTLPEEWAVLRSRILARIAETFGKAPAEIGTLPAKWEILDEYEKYGLRHKKIRYHILADEWENAVLVLPDGCSAENPAKAVITIHGTNGRTGKYGLLDTENNPHRAYAIELARRGFVTLSPDQFGYGESIAEKTPAELYAEFEKQYPLWTLDSRRLFEQRRALDVLDTLPFVRHTGYGAMGNSLGGKAVLYLTAFDERIAVGVPSCGVSPLASNAYRYVHKNRNNMPFTADVLEKDGHAPWELSEILALCSPRAVLLLEPYNDPYNPYVSVTAECAEKAAAVYTLLGVPAKIAMFTHGDGHDTVPTVRNFAYDWLQRWLA